VQGEGYGAGAVLDVLHSSAELLFVNKPAGLVCHPTRDGELSSLIGRVRLHLGHGEGRLVNRLDRETSGVVLIAAHAAAARDLGRLFGTAHVDKRYWAIVHGHIDADALTIDAPLGRDVASAVAIKDTVRADGAAARTDVAVLRRFLRNGEAYSWVDVTPRTGRKHQIRIHLAHVGHPIVGDKIYGGDEQRYLRFVTRAMTDDDAAALKVTNHLLHARRLAFRWRDADWSADAEPGAEFRQWID
jgi:23S rRNA pseudouridine1911/1915/1917 synthase